MKKFFQEHMGILIAIAVGASIIGLATRYGEEGGVVDNTYQETFSYANDVVDGALDNNNNNDNNDNNDNN